MMRSVRGVISIYLVLSFMVIMSLILGIIHTIQNTSAITILDMSVSLGLDSTFSYYDSRLFEDYGILAMKADEMQVIRGLEKIIDENISYQSGLVYLKLKEVGVKRLFGIKSMDGGFFERQVVDMSKYSLPVDIAASIIDVFLGISESVELDETSRLVNEYLEKESRYETELYRLIGLVDGVKVNGRDIVDFDGQYVEKGEEYVKWFAYNSNNSNYLNISYQPVFIAICNEGYDFERSLKRLRESITADPKEFQFARKGLINTSNRAITYYDNAIECADNIIKLLEELNEESESLKDELSDLISVDKTEVADIPKLREGLDRNREVLRHIVSLKKASDSEFLIESEKLITDYHFRDIGFDYTRIHIFGDGVKSPADLIESLYKDHILGPVTMPKTLSGKVVSREYTCDYSADANFREDERIARIMLFDEYVLRKFNSFIDYYGDDASPSVFPLDYEVEYILKGKNSDKANLEAVVNDIILFREGINMAYLLTDSEKHSECQALATSLCGATANAAVVGGVTILLMAAWAYGESVVDARILLDGRKLALYKSKDTWRLSLDNLLAGNFDVDGDDSDSHGLSYVDYLRFFLYRANYGGKNIRTINIIELEMKSNYDSEFSMGDMIIGADVDVIFSIPGDDSYYKGYSFSY